ncbi:hypothetical protein [Polyangium jinanense]|uniref:Uncharacterized protein n=1 Tax=Polyangium jinanense TaxID=2829994 RepID=A0A9X3WYU9_9BACT|nr:hypothetical protein [Polyangium jinanense]MDC3953021.1 hypothetical protein [Polyangium jinanense]MDC3980639.1 hypothetical protein [Polyangium jinanense]
MAPAPPRTPPSETPLPLLVSAGLLVALLGSALAHRSFFLAAYLAIVALVPAVPRERLRALGVALAWIGVAVCVVAIVLVPLGARVSAVYLPGCAVLLVRVAALRAASTQAWAVQTVDSSR